MSNIAAFTTIPTYSNLIEAVKVYINRFDQDTIDTIPFFINAAEKTILRSLRMPSMEKIVKFSISEAGNPEEGFVNLPNDYLEMRFMWVSGDKATTLQRVTFDQLIDFDNKMDPKECYDYGRPVWAINADRIYIRDLPYDKEVYMTYYADIPELSHTSEGNVLLDLCPDAFLFYSVAEGFRFLMEETKADYWEMQGTKRLEQIRLQIEDAEFSGSPLVISPRG